MITENQNDLEIFLPRYSFSRLPHIFELEGAHEQRQNMKFFLFYNTKKGLKFALNLVSIRKNQFFAMKMRLFSEKLE